MERSAKHSQGKPVGSDKSKTTQDSTSTTKPLDWQESSLENIFKQANDLYNQQSSQGTPDYNTYVGLNNTQTGALNNEISSANTQANYGNSTMQTGSNLLNNAGSGSQALNSTSQLASSGANGNFNQGSTRTSDSAQGLTNYYNGTAASALNQAQTLASQDPTSSNTANMQNYLQSSGISDATKDATAQNIQDATDYANSSGVSDAIKNAIAYSDNLYQRTTGTNLNAAAVGGGNLNSSRAGAYSAVQDSLQSAKDQDTASSMYQDAYNTGLSTAEQARESNLSGLLSGSSTGYNTSEQARESNTSNLLNTASTGLSGVNTGITAQNASNSQVNANNSTQQNYLSLLGNAGQALVNSASTGSDLQNAGATLTNNAYSNQLNAGSAYQQNDQSQNDANLQAQLQENQYPWTLLNNLYSIEGSNNWGSQTNSHSTSTTTTTPSVGSQIQGAVGSVSSLASSAFGGGFLKNLFGSSSKSS